MYIYLYIRAYDSRPCIRAPPAHWHRAVRPHANAMLMLDVGLGRAHEAQLNCTSITTPSTAGHIHTPSTCRLALGHIHWLIEASHCRAPRPLHAPPESELRCRMPPNNIPGIMNVHVAMPNERTLTASQPHTSTHEYTRKAPRRLSRCARHAGRSSLFSSSTPY